MCICLKFGLIFVTKMLHNQYMSNSITEIFKIDRVGKGIAVKALFAFLVLIRFSFLFIPDEAYDFKAFNSFGRQLINNPQLAYDLTPEDIPLTNWNCFLIMCFVFFVYIMIVAFCLYVGLFIRDQRLKTGKGKAISVSELVARMIVLSVFVAIVYVPVVIFLFYLILLLIILSPWLIMYPACYLSGDSGLLGSLTETYRKTRGYYAINVRNVCIILMVSFFIKTITSLISEVAPAAGYITNAFAETFILLCIARYAGLIYFKMIEVPFGIIRRPPTVNR